MTEERLVLIDTDGGIDDATAIIMLIKAHKNPDIALRIVGITCVNGNSTVDNCTVNVTRVLELMDVNEIPIFRGASQALVLPYIIKYRFHGQDGFGDTNLPKVKPKLEAEHAVNAIVRLAHEYSGRLTILTLGPLTNLALAIRMDSTIGTVIKDLYLMGGNIQGAGNDSICAEFNFCNDPEAAYILLDAYKCPVFIIPMEIGRDKIVQTYEWRMTELKSEINTPESRLINLIEANNLETRYKPTGKWTSHDSGAAVAFLTPTSITKLENYHCTVELCGKHTKGQLLVDFNSVLNPPGNIFIVTNIDGEIFRKMLKWAFGGPCPI